MPGGGRKNKTARDIQKAGRQYRRMKKLQGAPSRTAGLTLGTSNKKARQKQVRRNNLLKAEQAKLLKSGLVSEEDLMKIAEAGLDASKSGGKGVDADADAEAESEGEESEHDAAEVDEE